MSWSGQAAPIHDAVESRNLTRINDLLSEDPGQVNAATDGGSTPLHIAAGMNEVELTRLLISKGAKMTGQTKKGYTALHWAAYMNADKTAHLLIQAGANVNARTADGATPMQIAVAEDAKAVVKLLTTQTRTGYGSAFLNARFKEGQAARQGGDLQKAYDIFSELVREDPGDENINFTYGLTCYSMEEYSHARLAFGRALQINPQNDRARYELARTYIAMHQPELAWKEFEVVLSHNPPPDVRQKIRELMGAVERSVERRQMSYRLNLGYFLDDNVNVGPESDSVSISPIIFGSQTITELTLDEDSQPVKSQGGFVSASASGSYDAGKKGGWAWVGSFSFYQNFLDDQPDYESMYAQLLVGPQRAAGHGMVRLPLRAAHISNGHEPLVNIYALSPQFAYVQGAASEWQWISSLSLESRDYDTLDTRDGFYVSAGETMRHTFSKQGHNMSLGLAFFHDYTDEGIYEHSGVKTTMGAQFVLPKASSLYVTLFHTEADYKEQEVLSPVERKDTRKKLTVGLSKRFSRNVGVDLNHQVSDSDSSFALYEYHRNVTTLSAYTTF